MTNRSYEELLNRITKCADLPGVKLVSLGEFESGGRTYCLVSLEMGEPGPGKMDVMIAAGIHADEPAGVEAALRFVEEQWNNDGLLSCFHFVIFPCNNPTGWELNTRENAEGIDLNREFASHNSTPEIKLIMQSLQGRCFDLVYEMHEDIDSPGLYLYEISNDPREHVGEAIIEAVKSLSCPVNFKRNIEGMQAAGGLIRRKVIKFRKTHVPQAIFTYRTCGGHVITMEPPASVLSFEMRVKVLLTGLWVSLDAMARLRKCN